MTTSPEPVVGMRWAAARSVLTDPFAAAIETCDLLGSELGAHPIDLVLMFLSTPHVANAETIARTVRERLRPGCLMGSSARGVVTSGEEIENGVALSVIAARLPGVEVRPFLLTNDGWDEALRERDAFDAAAPGVRDAEVVFMSGDPFSLDIERVLQAFNRHAPGLRVVGGMASAGVRAGSNVVILNDWQSHEGGVAVALHGALRVDIVVSQGCAPIGPPLDVTAADQNIILTLDGQPALERAEQVLRALPESERERLKQGLYVGRPARGDASGRGDYLIRNLLGADRERGAIAVADRISLREKIRLHVRDAGTAVEDLEMLLSPQAFDSAAGAALMFECTGRGRMLHGAPDRDLTLVREALGASVPIAGMFCAGEIGPVGERNFLHGHTASIAILRSAPARVGKV